ncbi:MAG: hypothetical protein Q7J98_09460 [Kiritimatiellia bacterium]|nr:hypothetical protein [Kiritimatiellia bacterium]
MEQDRWEQAREPIRQTHGRQAAEWVVWAVARDKDKDADAWEVMLSVQVETAYVPVAGKPCRINAAFPARR